VSGVEPVAGASGAAPDRILVTVGDISCSQYYVVTPGGTYPLAHTTWIMSNNSTTTESIPTYAIVLAVVFFVFCLLGLLFLLVKEHRTEGFVSVSVQGPGFFHVTQIPVTDRAQIADTEGRVNYIRSLVAALP
jgi:hypothetical protein